MMKDTQETIAYCGPAHESLGTGKSSKFDHVIHFNPFSAAFPLALRVSVPRHYFADVTAA